MKQIEAKQDKVTVNWVLHQGGSGAILPKIKATWPNAEYDYVAGWEGSFSGMLKEDCKYLPGYAGGTTVTMEYPDGQPTETARPV